jgi:hypothetical protein
MKKVMLGEYPPNTTTREWHTHPQVPFGVTLDQITYTKQLSQYGIKQVTIVSDGPCTDAAKSRHVTMRITASQANDEKPRRDSYR